MLDRFSGLPTVKNDRHQADGKEDESYERKLPIHVEQNEDAADDADRLLEQVAADGGEGHLHAAGIVGDARHEKARAHLVKEIHRMPDHFAEQLIANVRHDPVAHPLHKDGVAISAETAGSHDEWNEE